ncbi:calbindin-32 isoform X1 [Brachionus plicatilis]|uniref:Calbindin-32 isoform X1 n=1 Tax=Brachionus plicatilis TaxID=10195 RepID=A0A3M7PHL4_BRAPC|nr:calbindin-32 isoform X1 [Brachionus plicatilis]
MSKRENFLRKFRDEKTKELNKISATEFMEIWNHYDADGNGFIEGKELDKFLNELCNSVHKSDVDAVPESLLQQFRETVLDAYDENDDGKISVQELAEILPTDENFLFIFRRENLLESSNFMKIWLEFDIDKSGFIEVDELRNFIKKLFESMKDKNADLTEEKLTDYTQSILKIFDKNSDGKLQLSEMIKLLDPNENNCLKTVLNSFSLIKKDQLDDIFSVYDKDGNQQLHDEEIDALAKDLIDIVNKDYTAKEFEQFKKGLLNLGDVNHDGKISKQELYLILTAFTSKNLHELDA